jgi:chorismate mutase
MFDTEIKELRNAIDQLDLELCKAVSRRMQLVKKVGELKKKNNIEVVQNDRWQQLLDSRMSWAVDLGMTSEEIRELFEALHSISVNRQKGIIKQ